MAYRNEVLLSVTSIRQGMGNEAVSFSGLPATGQTIANIGGANRISYMPVYIDAPGIITKLWCRNGATIAGNVAMALYACVAGQPTTQLATSGAVAQAGVSAMQEFDITDLTIDSPRVLFVALVSSDATATFYGGFASALAWKLTGMKQQSSAMPPPATATPVTMASSAAPIGSGVAFRALVA